MTTTINNSLAKVLTVRLKSGEVVTAKQVNFCNDLYPITYASEKVAQRMADKLRAKGVECRVTAHGRLWHYTYYVELLGGYEPAAPRGEAEHGGGGIHVKTWPHGGSATMTDMTNAGKRGKRCRVFKVNGAMPAWYSHGEREARAADYSARILQLLTDFESNGAPFAAARDAALELIEEARSAGVSENYLSTTDEEIRGIDAPKPLLVAGVDNVWRGHADEDGISLHALNDVNEWSEVTHPDQTGARAYAIAVKVWDRVKLAQTVHEAARILSDAGARLHGWCGLD